VTCIAAMKGLGDVVVMCASGFGSWVDGARRRSAQDDVGTTGSMRNRWLHKPIADATGGCASVVS
jgi:hypothetical protein